ncbi:NAF1-domain-containing protein [Wolfiporia cocos MD-104 SS10]|uniref:H/ACA ribonucleoprotein complex non-core subunit NAF1 n=1 Tax=Wolfiporia cocos (strain MD-104) TaxID=742152 RepID=A0A2H3JE42_WOLCO|nr:NAF1-domain-containing protein [Wolfiporia cocos MD-104 SS10]
MAATMATTPAFKVPSLLAQDLQLIHGIVGDLASPPSPKSIPPPNDEPVDDIGSSESDLDSEEEVEALYLADAGDDESRTQGSSEPVSDPDSSSSSDSDYDDPDDACNGPSKAAKLDDADMDDDETGPAITSEAQVRTKNEVPESEIVVPDIEEVGPYEEMHKVGEIISIVDKVVIVKGIAFESAIRASERALDSDTLLVFDDRKVLGYIYETFGPTTQPLYQVRFNQKYPLDPEKVQLSRPVFHVPERSNFVFVRALQRFKGSDASNVHDEEPAEEELDFSDDEAEAAHKRALAHRREQPRSRSMASSRHATPTPSQMKDQDMAEDMYGANPYDNSGPYNDMDLGAGPSRPAPIPYDDPYSDSYGVADPLPSTSTPTNPRPSNAPAMSDEGYTSDGGGSAYGDRGRGRGRRFAPSRGGAGRRDERGWGRGRDRPRGNRGRGRGRGRDDRGPLGGPDRGRQPQANLDEYDPRAPRSLSPTSLAIARATGQYPDGTAVGSDLQQPQLPSHASGSWAYSQYAAQQPYDYAYGYQNQFVQPHINPRFASSFGMNLAAFAQGNQYYSYGYSAMGRGGGTGSAGGWNQDWNAHTSQSDNLGEGAS